MDNSNNQPESSPLSGGATSDNTYHSANPIELSQEEIIRIQQEQPVNNFMKQKLEKDAKKNWDLFYKRNGDRFFKHRYWTKREFEELYSLDEPEHSEETSRKYLLEIGCGCGDFVLPLLESGCKFFIYCCDFSDKAIEVLKNNDLYKQKQNIQVKAFVADVTVHGQLKQGLDSNEMDIVSMIFVLSAIDPNKVKPALQSVFEVLKPGGMVLFRDYALYDYAMLRFKQGQKISDNFYFRQDGTMAYFFDKDLVSNIFSDCGFEIINVEYVRRQTINVGENLDASRVFVQGKFRKPVI